MGKCKNTSQLLEKGVSLAFLLLATGTGTDKVPGNQTNVTHSPPPLSEALSVHNHAEESRLNTT